LKWAEVLRPFPGSLPLSAATTIAIHKNRKETNTQLKVRVKSII